MLSDEQVVHSVPPVLVAVEHVSKVYRLDRFGSSSSGQGSVQAHALARLKALLVDKTLQGGLASPFVALDDVSFTVRRGEAIALVGHNGAGKSTLLGLLSRISLPSTGKIMLYGRINTGGFDPSSFSRYMTGRENIMALSTMLGDSWQAIGQRVEAIADFAELGDFMDAPIKTYSWGMTMRLALSILVHTPFDVLVLDEGLAKLDDAFKAKVIDRLRALNRDGVALIVACHQTGLLDTLCTRGLLLEHGCLVQDGPLDAVRTFYEAGQQRFGDPVQPVCG